MGLANIQTMTEYLDDYLKDFFIFLKRENTKEAYNQHLNHFTNTMFGYELKFITRKDLLSINTDLVIKYKNKLIESKFANGTISNRLSALRTFVGYMKFRKLTEYDVSADVKYVGNMEKDSEHYDTIPMKAVEEMIEYFRTKERYLRSEKEWFIKLAVETGLRADNLLKLKKKQFTVMSDGIHVMIKSDEETKGKGNKDWKEMIHINFYNELKEKFFTESQYLFTMDESTIRKRIQAVMKKLGYEGRYTTHSLKRTSVTNTMDFTNDPRAAQAKGKHSNMNTTFNNYIDHVDYGATGYYSMQYSITDDHIATATHEELLKAIDNLEPNVVLLIQAQLQKLKGEC